MSSSPSSVKQRSPKRTSPKRTPLQERTPSQANELTLRLYRDVLSDPDYSSVYTTTPFPTKPAHVLLPSSIKKKKRAGPGSIGDALAFPFEGDAGRSNDGHKSLRGGAQPTVKLKRSVKALRDLYESQAGDASRPSTATSPPLRPTTAGSSRLRSLSSNESLSGAYTWESLRKISSDDLALLPTLPAGSRAARRVSSRSSFTSLAEKIAATSSPNYRVLGVSSSPNPPVFKDVTSPVLEPFEEIPSTESLEDSSSSPNVIRLGHTSSTEQFQTSDQSSSPNVVKLGTSSPLAARPETSSYFAHSRSSSRSSRKRKRSDTGGSRSFADRIGARNPLASSPPVDRYIPTSAIPSSISSQEQVNPSVPESLRHTDSIDESSPVVQVLNRDESSSDGSSLADTHASLQAALSSSPPRIQYPIVHAPPASQQAGLVVPKRFSRSLSTDLSGPRYTARLSAVPSEGSWVRSRPVSDASFVPDDLDEYLHSDELAPASTFIINNHSAAQSQIRIVRDSDSDLYGVDSHEATDAVSALPTDEYTYRSPPLRRAHSGSFFTSPNSSLSRLNSMKSFTLSRHNSYISTSLRPSSSSSTASNVHVPVPGWARRYYSGQYMDPLQYVYASASHSNLHNLSAPGNTQPPLALPASSQPETSRPEDSPTRRRVHQTMAERLHGLMRPKTRPRLEARKSHTLPGVGPLVSNPVSEATTAAAVEESRHQPNLALPNSVNHTRSVSAPLPPLDPRAHWAGMIEIHEQPLEDGRGSSYLIHHHHIRAASYGYSISRTESQSQSMIYHPNVYRSLHRWASSPHLHHDHRLNTGSTESRGFGHPFNIKSRWTAPSIIDEPGRSWLSKADLRTAQIMCFTTGFLFPPVWFVAAFLPLPKRPASMADIEKAVPHAAVREQQLQPQSQRRSIQQQNQTLSESEPMDVVAKLRLERQYAGVAELRWQNARWWRNLNRWMCIIGVVVCVIVIVLAVVGTQRNW